MEIIGMVLALGASYWVIGAVLLICLFSTSKAINSISFLLMAFEFFALKQQYGFELSMENVLAYSAVYFVVGIISSFYLYFSYVKEKTKNGVPAEYLKPSSHTSDIVGWIFNWPFALLIQAFGDFFSIFGRFVTGFLGSAYHKIFLAATRR